ARRVVVVAVEGEPGAGRIALDDDARGRVEARGVRAVVEEGQARAERGDERGPVAALGGEEAGQRRVGVEGARGAASGVEREGAIERVPDLPARRLRGVLGGERPLPELL